MIEEVRDKRPEFANRLRELANQMDIADDQPIGLLVQIFWKDQTISRLKRTEPGYNPLLAAGLLLRTAQEETSDPNPKT